jgi:hypothetical protein
MLPITIGADPEFFLESKLSGGLKSAVNQVGGTKAQPKELSRAGFFIQEDNVAVEFNIPPAKTLKAFVESIDWSMKTISATVGEIHLRPKISAAEIFPPYELLDPRAQEFGCDPDFNAWFEGAVNGRPLAKNQCLRTCSGNIHVAIHRKVKSKEEKEKLIWSMVKGMDLYLSVPAVMMANDGIRRELYGKAGAFRYQNHSPIAWEHRVLSNFWIQSPELAGWVYKQTIRAVNHVWKLGPKKFEKWLTTDDLSAKIQHCINQSDVNLAQTLINDYDLVTV